MTNILHTARTGMSMGGLFAMIYEHISRLDVIGLVSILEFRTERADDSYRRSTTGEFLSPIPT